MSKNIFNMVEALKPEIPPSSTLVFGTVIDDSPLTIRTDNRVELSGKFLVLSKMCRKFVIYTAKHYHMGVHGATDVRLEELEIWRGIEIGDRVIMFQFGQIFYVAERVDW